MTQRETTPCYQRSTPYGEEPKFVRYSSEGITYADIIQLRREYLGGGTSLKNGGNKSPENVFRAVPGEESFADLG